MTDPVITDEEVSTFCYFAELTPTSEIKAALTAFLKARVPERDMRYTLEEHQADMDDDCATYGKGWVACRDAVLRGKG